MPTKDTPQGKTLDEKQQEIKKLAALLIRAEQRERDRIAQLLHNEIQPWLYGAKVKADLLQNDPSPEKDAARWKQLEGLIDRSMQAARTLTVEINPVLHAGEDLEEALRWVAGHVEEVHGLVVTVTAHPSHTKIEDEVRIFLIQAVRELLFNIVKHAGVDQARVSLLQDVDVCVVRVEDDGTGFEASVGKVSSSGGSGSGLASVGERVRWLGGELDIESAPGRGTRIDLRLPVPGKSVG